jgi:glucose/arabinose dehydrogenase
MGRTVMKSISTGLACFGLAVALTAGAAAPEEQDEQSIKFSEAPAAVQKTLHDETKGAKIETVNKVVTDGETAYWTSLVLGGRTYELEVTEKGQLVEMTLAVDEADVQFSDLPAAVQKTFQSETRDAKLEVVHKDLKYGVPIFEAVAPLGGKDYEVVVAEDGTLVEKMLLIEDDEVELADCPAHVQKMFKDEARGGEVKAITRSSGIHKRVYEGEITIHGLSYFLEVAESGMLISKTLEQSEE